MRRKMARRGPIRRNRVYPKFRVHRVRRDINQFTGRPMRYAISGRTSRLRRQVRNFYNRFGARQQRQSAARDRWRSLGALVRRGYARRIMNGYFLQ